MTQDNPQSIRAHREIIWHLTCPSCKYYWTYPTMRADENIAGKQFHCPLCGVQAPVEVSDAP